MVVMAMVLVATEVPMMIAPMQIVLMMLIMTCDRRDQHAVGDDDSDVADDTGACDAE